MGSGNTRPSHAVASEVSQEQTSHGDVRREPLSCCDAGVETATALLSPCSADTRCRESISVEGHRCISPTDNTPTPRSVISEHSQSIRSLAENSCMSSVLTGGTEEYDELESETTLDEDTAPEGDAEDEADEEDGDGDEQEDQVKSLRRWRTQQAIRNMLLEKEVAILQAQLHDLELMEKEEASAQSGDADAPCAHVSNDMAGLNLLYKHMTTLGTPTTQRSLSPSLSASDDKSCVTEPGDAVGRPKYRVKRSGACTSGLGTKRRNITAPAGANERQKTSDVCCSYGAGSREGPGSARRKLDHRDETTERRMQRTGSFSSQRSTGSHGGDAARRQGGRATGATRRSQAARQSCVEEPAAIHPNDKWAFPHTQALRRKRRTRSSQIVFADNVGGYGAYLSGAVKRQSDRRNGDGNLSTHSASTDCDTVTGMLLRRVTRQSKDRLSSHQQQQRQREQGTLPSSKVKNQKSAEAPPSGQPLQKLMTPDAILSAAPQRKPSNTSKLVGAAAAPAAPQGPLTAGSGSGRWTARKRKQSSAFTPLSARLSTSTSNLVGPLPLSPDLVGAKWLKQSQSSKEVSTATQWAEVELLLKRPIHCNEDVAETLAQAEAAIRFMDRLETHAKELHVLRGTLAQWLLPYNTNTEASGQSSVTNAVRQNEPEGLRGKLVLSDINYLICGANNLRGLIRFKIADDADLDQARKAVETAKTFLLGLTTAAAGEGTEPYDLLLRIMKPPVTPQGLTS